MTARTAGRRALAAVAAALLLGGCGVRAQAEPVILDTPVPTPTVTPSVQVSSSAPAPTPTGGPSSGP